MSRFENTETKVVVSVDDSKDDRFGSPLWKAVQDEAPKRRAAKKAESESSDD